MAKLLQDKEIKRKLGRINMIIMAALVMIVVLVTPLILAQFSQNSQTSAPQSISDIVAACRGMTMAASSKCVVNVTSNFYKYNIDNVGKTLDFSQLKSEGGVCSNWSEYYTRLGRDLGYEAKNIIIPTSGNSYHEFSVWSENGAYCVIDQTNFSCFSLGGN